MRRPDVTGAACAVALLTGLAPAWLWLGRPVPSPLHLLGLLPWILLPLAAAALWRESAPWPRAARWAAQAALAALALTALAPLTGWDGLAYHLALPKRFLGDPRAFWEGYDQWFTFVPLGGPMLYLLSLPWGEATALLWVPLGWAACLWASARLCAEWGAPKEGWVALASFPLARFAAGGYVDAPLCAFALLAFLALERWRTSGRWRDLLASGLLAGAAAAFKHSALPYAGVLALAVLLSSRRLLPALGFGLCALALPFPWLLRSWIATGNPVYPLAGASLGGPYLNLSYGYGLQAGMPLSGWLLFAGLLALSAPWLPLAALLRPKGSPAAWALAAAALAIAFVAPAPPDGRMRYTLPYLLPLGCLLAARLGPSRTPRLLLGGFAAAALALAWARTAQRLPVLLGLETRDAFLERVVDSHAGVRAANAAGARKVLLAGCRGFRLDMPYVAAHEAHAYVDYARARDLDGFLRRARAEGITHLLVELNPEAGGRTFLKWLPSGEAPGLRLLGEGPGWRLYALTPVTTY